MECMKQKIKNYYDLIYFLVLFVAIGLSLVYGQILEANIGEYPPYMVFGDPLPLWAIILIPLGISLLYAFSIYIAYKNSLIDFSKKSIAFIATLTTMFFYMVILVALKDNSHLFGYFTPPNNGPTINERIYSICTFYLSILMIYAFYALIRRTRNSKLFINLILIGVIIYALISVIYSLTTEMDKYKIVFSPEFNIFDKNYIGDNWIKSFYTIGNVYGHTCYVGILSFIFLGILNKQKYLCFFSLIFTPFVYASACRASILSTFILLFILTIYLIYPCFKKSKVIGFSYLSVLLIVFILIFLELYVFKNIQFTYQGELYSLKDLLKVVLSRMDSERISIIEMCYQNATLRDVIFGFGYGLHLLVPRTQGGYIYYMHNTFVEYFATGGIFYSAFISTFFISSLYKCIKMFKKKTTLFFYFVAILMSQTAYGMFESIPVLVVNFFGAVFGVYFFLIINLEYQEFIGEMNEIQTLDPIHTNYVLEFEVKDENDSLTSKKINEVVDLVKAEMVNDKIYNLNVVLLGKLESEKMIEENKLTRTYKSFYNDETKEYFLLSTQI